MQSDILGLKAIQPQIRHQFPLAHWYGITDKKARIISIQ